MKTLRFQLIAFWLLLSVQWANAKPLEEFRMWQNDPHYVHSIAAPWTRMGDRYLDEGDIDRALPLYEKALSLDKNFAPAYNNRAECYMALSRNEEAVDDLTRCIALGGSEKRVAMNSLARLQFGLQHYSVAVGLYNKLLAEVKNGVTFRNRADCYEAMGKFDLAIADLTEALKYDTKRELVLRRRARIYARLQKFDNAIADCSEVIKSDPDGTTSADANVGVLKLRAEIYKKLGKDALAKHDLDRIQHAYKNDDALAPFSTK